MYLKQVDFKAVLDYIVLLKKHYILIQFNKIALCEGHVNFTRVKCRCRWTFLSIFSLPHHQHWFGVSGRAGLIVWWRLWLARWLRTLRMWVGLEMNWFSRHGPPHPKENRGMREWPPALHIAATVPHCPLTSLLRWRYTSTRGHVNIIEVSFCLYLWLCMNIFHPFVSLKW